MSEDTKDSSLEITVNQNLLKVNSIQSKLAHMNHYANEFAVCLYNKAEDRQIKFRNSKQISAEECLAAEGFRMGTDIDKIIIRVSADVDVKQGYFATRAECDEFKFQMDKWSVTKRYDEKEHIYEWLLIPKETFILEPKEQIVLRVYDIEVNVEDEWQEENAELEIQVQYEEDATDCLCGQKTGMPEELTILKNMFSFKKEKMVCILDFFPDVGVVFPGGTETVQWNITGAHTGFLRNERTKETKDLKDLDKRIFELEIQESGDFTLEIADDKGNKDSRTLHIQTALPRLEIWRLNKQEEQVEWDIQCIKKLEMKDYPQKGRQTEDMLARNRGAMKLSEVGKTDRLTIFCRDTARDFESTLWIPNQKELEEVFQFRKTITYFDEYQLIQVVWELQERSNMTLMCHDLQRNQFWTIASNRYNGTWEQVVPRISGEKRDYMEIRLRIWNKASSRASVEENEIIF